MFGQNIQIYRVRIFIAKNFTYILAQAVIFVWDVVLRVVTEEAVAALVVLYSFIDRREIIVGILLVWYIANYRFQYRITR